MSGLARRLRRIEAKAGSGAGRLIVLLRPAHVPQAACDELLEANGITVTPADLMVRCLSRTGGDARVPRIERITRLV